MPNTPSYTAEQVKEAVNKLTAGRFQQFGSIIDIASFIWDVVNDMLDTFNDKNLTPKQKEDVAVGISRCVVSELESKNLISKELSEKMTNLINSADAFLETLLSVYNSEITKNILNVVCGWFGFSYCSKPANELNKKELPKSQKIEEIVVEADKIEDVKDETISDSEIPDLESIPK